MCANSSPLGSEGINDHLALIFLDLHELFPCLDLDLFPLQGQEAQDELEEETDVLLVPSGPPGAETRHAASSPQGPTPLASVRPWPGPFVFDGLDGASRANAASAFRSRPRE